MKQRVSSVQHDPSKGAIVPPATESDENQSTEFEGWRKPVKSFDSSACLNRPIVPRQDLASSDRDVAIKACPSQTCPFLTIDFTAGAQRTRTFKRHRITNTYKKEM